MKTIIAGTRYFNDWDLLESQCCRLNITEVVCGTAKGADELGRMWAELYQIPKKYFHPDWDKYGRSAGPIRNQQMADYADQLIAFWDGRSKGTADMIRRAENKGLIIKIVRYQP